MIFWGVYLLATGRMIPAVLAAQLHFTARHTTPTVRSSLVSMFTMANQGRNYQSGPGSEE